MAEEALLEALRERRIAGAALDCFETEPVVDPERSAGLENLLLAPHSIGGTNELFRDIGRSAYQAMVDLSLGSRPAGVLNPEVLERAAFMKKWAETIGSDAPRANGRSRPSPGSPPAMPDVAEIAARAASRRGRRAATAVLLACWAGATAPAAEPIPLRAGPLTLVFDVRCREREVDFLWHGKLVGRPEGAIDYTFDGEALADFERNRIGFCVLHRETAAGRPWRLEHSAGATEEGRFPEWIAPHQPAQDLRALAHEFTPGCWARVAFEGAWSRWRTSATGPTPLSRPTARRCPCPTPCAWPRARRSCSGCRSRSAARWRRRPRRPIPPRR